MLKTILNLAVSLLFLNATLSAFTAKQEYCPQCNQAPGIIPHLQYFGGPVVSNIKVIDVLWGPNVNSQVKASMPGYFTALVNSQWIESFSEYDTANRPAPTTGQRIGPGTFVGQFTIIPSNMGPTVTEAEVRTELAAQITAGHLPAPKYDAKGFPDSYYIIEFPPGIQIIADGGAPSCVVFCAFHSSMDYNGKPIMYAVQPDFGPGSGCEFGCGTGTMLQNQQSVHCHELAEVITDPEVGTGNYAWLDNNFGENADICVGDQAQVTLNGKNYTVQKTWSNRYNSCLAIIPVILPNPTNFVGKVVKNQTDLTHVLTWKASPSQYATGYYISQDGVRIATMDAKKPLTITLHNRVAKKVYTYGVRAFDASGNMSQIVKINVPQ